MNAPALRVDREAIDELERRHFRLASAVRSASRRRDVRELRARLVLMLLGMRCPVRGKRRRRWYVAGAVARAGAGGLARAWEAWWAMPAPTVRTLRSHLGALERAGVLVRAPGDWLRGLNPAAPHQRPRHPDTFHLLDEEEEAEWWHTRGRELLERDPSARHNPDRWRMLFGRWRARVRDELAGSDGQPCLPGLEGVAVSRPPRDRRPPAVRDDRPAAPEVDESVARLEEVVHRPGVTAGEVVGALDRAGVRLRGANRSRVQHDLDRLRGAAALLARALARGDRVRNRPGWVVAAWAHAPDRDLAHAIRSCERRSLAPRELLAEVLGAAGAGELLENLKPAT